MAKPRDDIDDRLLDLLVADSRTPLKQLGATVGLSTSAVQERIARLERGDNLGSTIARLLLLLDAVGVWGHLGERAQLRTLLLDVYGTDGGLPAEAAPAVMTRPPIALPTAADVERLLARYTLPGVVSIVGPPSGPTDLSSPAS